MPSRSGANAFQYAWKSPWVRLIIFLLGFYLAYRLFNVVSEVVVDFTISFLIAYLASPLLNWLEKVKIRRGLGAFFVVLLFLGLFTMLGALIVTVSSQFADLLSKLPEQIGNLGNFTERVARWLDDRGVPGAENLQIRVNESLQTYVQNLGKNIGPILRDALQSGGTLFNGLVSIGSVIAQIVLILLMSVYLMLDYSRINSSLLRAFPRPWQPRVLELGTLVGTSVGGYVRGQILIAAAIGVMVWLGLSVIGIPSAAAIGFLAGIFNIVPYLGPVIGATPALLLALPGGGLKMLLVVLVFVIANQLEGSFLSPMILGRTTDLHPVTVLLAILIGVAVMGLPGALLSVPTAALIKLLLEKYYFPSRVYTEGP
ncbi:AI-2E family transporter [Deinococcus sp.]|uniref:AI-2E family transporter n=1 Tax=Deinococcus sp. TaxID=47478 RepID=UPI0025B8970C|nr:AI-2E family transporter [Deinococcus sp.]